MKTKLVIAVLGLVLGPLGCTMAPKYARPQAPVPADLPQGGAYPAGLGTANLPPARTLAWQQFYPDPRLRRVIGLALTNNLDLRTAAYNVQYYRALYGIQSSQMLPTVDATGTASRQRVPHDLSTTGKSTIQSQYGVNLGAASWELDFFGRIRSLKHAALQQYLATEQGRRSTQIALVAAVAGAYVTAAADQESLALARTTLESQQHSYDMVKHRYDLGLVHELDLDRARTQVADAERDVATYEGQAALDKNALDLLVGLPVSRELLSTNLESVVPPQELRVGLSSEVLLERPDILQAEAQLKAAYANIGAARAAFFPRINLTAAVGTASSDLSGLFKTGSGTWSYAPQVSLPVFDPSTWYSLKSSKARQQMATLQYQKAIQSAFRDVADALAVKGTIDRRLAAQQSLVEADASTYRLSDSRYLKGIDSYLSVLDAQRSLYAAQQSLVSIRLAKLSNQVNLYSVLGGGWTEAGATQTAAVAPGRK